MRIVKAFVTLVALIFGFVAVAFVALFTIIAVLFSRLFGRSPATPGAPRPASGQGSAPRTARFNSDDVIDVVTTPVAKE